MSSPYKTCIVLLLALALVGAAHAELIVTAPLNINTLVNTTYYFNITFNNNQTQDIYNLQWTPAQYLTLPSPVNISAGANATLQGQARTSEIVAASIASTLQYSTRTTTPSTPQVRDVVINLGSLTPNNLTTKKFDIVRFKNNHTANVTVKDVGNAFELRIAPGQSQNITYTTLGQQNYFIVENGFVGHLNVVENVDNVFIHDSAKDQTFTFNVYSSYEQATLNMTILTNSFTLNFDRAELGVLQLISTNLVRNVTLYSSKWVTFTDNGFDLNGSRLVTFTITPNVNATQDTNATHTISVSATSINAAEKSASITAFVNYHDFGTLSNSNGTTVQIIAITPDLLEAYCRDNPSKCPQQNITQEVIREKIVTKDAPEVAEFKGTQDRIVNDIGAISSGLTGVKDITSNLSGEVANTGSRLSLLERRLQQEDSHSLAVTIIKIIAIAILVMIAGAAALYIYITNYLRARQSATI